MDGFMTFAIYVWLCTAVIASIYAIIDRRS
jgi:hypothetical protein